MKNLPVVTKTLLWLNIGVFVLMCVEGLYFHTSLNNAWIIALNGGVSYGLVCEGHQYWRLLTAIFVHLGIMHLVMNMLMLVVLGPIAERVMGKAWFLALYLGSGIGGNIASVLFNTNTISAGASTALFGLLAVFLVIAMQTHNQSQVKELWKSYGAVLILNILYSFIGAGVDVWGHIGGAVFGVLIALIYIGVQRLSQRR